MVSFRVTLDRIAPSVNSAYYFIRKGKRTIKVKTVAAKEFFDYVKQVISKQTYSTMTEPIEVNVKFIFGTNRRHDLDNYQKLTNDSLRGILWLDDNQIQKITSEKFYQKGMSKTIIEVKEYEYKNMAKETNEMECI